MNTLYTFHGVIVHGKGMGSHIGYPTANLAVDAPPHMPRGVYAAQLCYAGQAYRAIANVGIHPTLPEGPPTIEIHLVGVSIDLYGKRVLVQFTRFLREERTFASIDALKAQIAQDIASLDE